MKIKSLFLLIVVAFVGACNSNLINYATFPSYNHVKCINHYKWAESEVLSIKPDSLLLINGTKIRPQPGLISAHCFESGKYQLLHHRIANSSFKVGFETRYVGVFSGVDTTNYIIQNTKHFSNADSVMALIRFFKKNEISNDLFDFFNKFYFVIPHDILSGTIASKELKNIGFSSKNEEFKNQSMFFDQYSLLVYKVTIDEYRPLYTQCFAGVTVDYIGEEPKYTKEIYYLTLIYYNKDLTEYDVIIKHFDSDDWAIYRYQTYLKETYGCKELYSP